MANALTSKQQREMVEAYLQQSPDCRTCGHYGASIYEEELGCTLLHQTGEPCTSGARYQPLPPVRLYRTNDRNAAVSAAKDAEIAALREALQGLMVGCKYYNIQGQWHWHEKAVATNEALDAARAALGDKT